jgi:tRNA threonylcarbamoyladenosine biosynthesis protein TsaE
VHTEIAGRHHAARAEETFALGERIGVELSNASPDGALVLLVGPLGAGKTVLAKGIARGFGVTEPVVSPTYTIMAEYAGGRVPLHHVDLYRIEGREQLENIGLEDLLRGNGIVVVEWGEKLGELLTGETWIRITIAMAPNGGRDMLVERMGG